MLQVMRGGTRVAQGISFLCATWAPLGKGENVVVFLWVAKSFTMKICGTDFEALGIIFKGFEHVRIYTACFLSIRLDPT